MGQTTHWEEPVTPIGEPDLVGLAQFALFNFPLGARSLVSPHARADRTPESPGPLLRAAVGAGTKTGSSIAAAESAVSIGAAFRSAVDSAVRGAGRVGLLLSAGYDSRCILAALSSLQVPALAVTWASAGSEREVRTAERLAASAGCRHRVIDPTSIDAAGLAASAVELVRRSNGISSLCRTPTYAVMRSLDSDVDVLLWGEGELIRPPAIPCEYVSGEALELLAPALASRPAGAPQQPAHMFSGELPWADARSEVLNWCARRHVPPGPRLLASWLAEEAYPKIYGSMARATEGSPRVSLPFLDRGVTRLLLRRKESLADRTDWRPRWRSIVRSRRVYHRIIAENDPRLLGVEVDRGYPLAWDADWRGALMTGVWGARARFRRGSVDAKRTMPLQCFLRDVLSDGAVVEYLDRRRVAAGVSRPMPWPAALEFQLAKAAAVQLLFR